MAAETEGHPDPIGDHPDIKRLDEEVARREQRAKKLRSDLDELLQQKVTLSTELDDLRAAQMDVEPRERTWQLYSKGVVVACLIRKTAV